LWFGLAGMFLRSTRQVLTSGAELRRESREPCTTAGAASLVGRLAGMDMPPAPRSTGTDGATFGWGTDLLWDVSSEAASERKRDSHNLPVAPSWVPYRLVPLHAFLHPTRSEHESLLQLITFLSSQMGTNVIESPSGGCATSTCFQRSRPAFDDFVFPQARMYSGKREGDLAVWCGGGLERLSAVLLIIRTLPRRSLTSKSFARVRRSSLLTP
jgi:hypothetical protein